MASEELPELRCPQHGHDSRKLEDIISDAGSVGYVPSSEF